MQKINLTKAFDKSFNRGWKKRSDKDKIICDDPFIDKARGEGGVEHLDLEKW